MNDQVNSKILANLKHLEIAYHTTTIMIPEYIML